jgi:hypothetical protein
MFRNSGKDDFIVDLPTVEQFEPVNRNAEPGPYHVDETSTKPVPSGHTARRCGIGTKRADGSVEIEPDPWES